MKYSYALVYLIVLIFSTCVFSSHEPNGKIVLTSPGEGPFKYTSVQAITWNANLKDVEDPYNAHTTCQVSVCVASEKDEYGCYTCEEEPICTEEIRYTYGYAQFTVDDRFDTETDYIAVVEFKQGELYYIGTSPIFTKNTTKEFQSANAIVNFYKPNFIKRPYSRS
ncbi:9029_t:CDS:2 [Diversispora eburnea]|uniref:9029_t:CDS:1 n=1 Tax=Diversispora eburnea TaxID=1213867 RepID=A0A9N8V4Y5_9GLOM|nr:9029_t:CDS:2 [Diversispora eburnea]